MSFIYTSNLKLYIDSNKNSNYSQFKNRNYSYQIQSKYLNSTVLPKEIQIRSYVQSNNENKENLQQIVQIKENNYFNKPVSINNQLKLPSFNKSNQIIKRNKSMLEYNNDDDFPYFQNRHFPVSPRINFMKIKHQSSAVNKILNKL